MATAAAHDAVRAGKTTAAVLRLPRSCPAFAAFRSVLAIVVGTIVLTAVTNQQLYGPPPQPNWGPNESLADASETARLRVAQPAHLDSQPDPSLADMSETAKLDSASDVAELQRVAGINIWIGSKKPLPQFYETLETWGNANAAAVADYLWFVDDEALAQHARGFLAARGIHNIFVINEFMSPLRNGETVPLSTFLHEQVWLETRDFTGLKQPPHYEFGHNLCDVRPLFGLVFKSWIDAGPAVLRQRDGQSVADPPRAYSHWGWIDHHTYVGNLLKFVDGGRDLNDFDIVSFRYVDAPHIFTSGQLTIYRNAPSTNFLWQRIDRKTLTRVFNRDEAAKGATQSMVFDEFWSSNNAIFSPADTGVRIKISFVSGLSPTIIAARVKHLASDAADKPMIVAAPSKKYPEALPTLYRNHLAGYEQRLRQKAQWTPTVKGETWRDVRVPADEIAGRFMNRKALLPKHRGFFSFWRDSAGQWFERTPDPQIVTTDSETGALLYYEVVLAHTRKSLCSVAAAELRSFNASRPRFEGCFLQ